MQVIAAAAAAAAGKKSSSSGMPALGWWLMAVGALLVGLTCSGFFGAATYARAESTCTTEPIES